MIRKILQYVSLTLVLTIIGCPNTMIGLGDKVDLDPPSLSIGTYGNGDPINNGDYVRGKVTLTGSVADDIGIKNVTISFDGGTTFLPAAVSGKGKTWSYPVDTRAYADGEKNIIVLVTDTSPKPKTSEKRLLLYFDNTPPVVEVTVSPGFTSSASDSAFP